MPRMPLPPPLLLSLGFAICATVVAFRPVGDVDIFWQLKLGDLALEHRSPYMTEPFLVHRAGVPHDPICWLAQVIFAAVRQLCGGDWRAVRVFDALVFVGTFLVVLWPAARRIRDWPAGWVTTVAGGMGFMCALPYTTVRPQTFMFFAFGLAIAILATRWSLKTKTVALFFTLLFWQNVHPSTGVAAVLFGASAAVGWLRYVLKYRTQAPWAETIASLLAALVQPLTPAGMAIFEIAKINRHMCTQVFYINEWMSIFHPKNAPWNLHGLVTFGLTLVLVAVRRRRVHWEELALAVAVFALCAIAIRFTLMLSIALVPVWVRCLTPATVPQTEPPGRGRWWLLVLALVFPGLASYTLKPVVHEPTAYPFEGIRKLKERQLRGVFYTHFMWGGLVVDEGYPAWRISHDGRYYLHTEEAWDDYLRAKDGHTAVEDVFREFQPVAVLLRPEFEKGLVDRLRNDPRYEEIDTTEWSVVFVLKSAR